MRTVALIINFLFGLATGSAFAADGETWKLHFEQDAKTQQLTQLYWHSGEKKVQALSNDLKERIVGRPTLFQNPAVPIAVLVVPRFGLKPKNGNNSEGAVLLQPGKTATSTLEFLMPFKSASGKQQVLSKAPTEVEVHENGFYFSLRKGAYLYLGTYQLDKASKPVVIFSKPLIEAVRNQSVKITFTPDGVLVGTKTANALYGPDGKQKRGDLAFRDFTLTDESILVGQFKAIDLVEAANFGEIQAYDFNQPHLNQVLNTLRQSGSKSSILINTQSGIESEGIVHLLAKQLADQKLPELEGWRLFEIPWGSLSTEGLVGLTTDKVRDLLNACRYKKVILFIPDIQQMIGLGVDPNSTNKGDAAQSMYRDIKEGRVVVIGATSAKGINYLRTKGGRFHQSFQELPIKEPRRQALWNLVRSVADQAEKRYEKPYQLKYPDALITEIIRTTNQFIPREQMSQPKKSIQAISEIGRNPMIYLSPAEQKWLKNKPAKTDFAVTKSMLQNWLSLKSGISTLSKTGDGAAFEEFLLEENFMGKLNKHFAEHENAKKALWGALASIADPDPLDVDVEGGEVSLPILLLVGPSGVGKSYLPKVLSNILKKDYGIDWPHHPLEMSSAKDTASVKALTGADPAYIGYDPTGSPFVRFLKDNRQGTIVFEEIDKMHRDVMELFYPFLEEGRFQFAGFQNVRWTRGLLVLTSNYGAQGTTENGRSDLIDQWDAWKFFGKEPREELVKAGIKSWSKAELKRRVIDSLITSGKVSPQVIRRIGISNVIIMHHFTRAGFKNVYDRKLSELQALVLRSRGCKLEFTPKAKKEIWDRGWGPDGENAFQLGAGAIIGVIRDGVRKKISTSLRTKRLRSINLRGKTLLVDALPAEGESHKGDKAILEFHVRIKGEAAPKEVKTTQQKGTVKKDEAGIS